jgi:hypothetical protein
MTGRQQDAAFAMADSVLCSTRAGRVPSMVLTADCDCLLADLGLRGVRTPLVVLRRADDRNHDRT